MSLCVKGPVIWDTNVTHLISMLHSLKSSASSWVPKYELTALSPFSVRPDFQEYTLTVTTDLEDNTLQKLAYNPSLTILN